MNLLNKSAEKIYRGSFRWLSIAVGVNASLLAYSLVTGDSSTPPEVRIADTIFLALSIGLIPLCLRRNRGSLFGALLLGFLLIPHVIGDLDFMVAAEGTLEGLSSTLPELAYFAAFTIFAFIQTLSAYGAILLRKVT